DEQRPCAERCQRRAWVGVAGRDICAHNREHGGDIAPTILDHRTYRVAPERSQLRPLDISIKRAADNAPDNVADQPNVIAVAEDGDGILDAHGFRTAEDARL